MIIGATRGSGGSALARHLTDVDANERVELLDARDLASDDLASQLEELVAGASHGRTDRPLLHVHLDPAKEYSEKQWEFVLSTYEAEFGLQEATRMAVEHHKEGRTHRHIGYSLVGEDGKVIDLSHNWLRHQKVARITEYEFGEKFTPGRHDKALIAALERDGRHDVANAMREQGLGSGLRPERAIMTPHERHQAGRQGIDLAAFRKAALTAWKSADGPQAFESALAENGYALAQGRKTTMIVDAAGNALSLSRVLNAACKEAREPRIPSEEVKDRVGGLLIPPLAQLKQARVDVAQPAAQPISGRQALAAATAKMSGPSIGGGSGAAAGSGFEASNIAPIDPDKPGDFERFMRQFSADVQRKMQAAHQIQVAAIKNGSQGGVEAARKLAEQLQKAFAQLSQRGGPELFPKPAHRIVEASKHAISGDFEKANHALEGTQNDNKADRGVDRSTVRQEARPTPFTAGSATGFSPHDRGPAVSVHGLRGLQARRHLSNIDKLRDLGPVRLLRNPAFAGARGSGGRLGHALQSAPTGGERGDAGSGLTPWKNPAQQAAKNLSVANKKALAVLSDRPKVFDLDRLAARIDGEIAAKLDRLKARAERAEEAARAKAGKVGFLASVFRTASFKSARKAADKARTLRESADQFEIDGRYTERRQRRMAAETSHRGKLAEQRKFDSRAEVRKANQAVADVKAIRVLCRAGEEQLIAAAAKSLAEAQRLLRQREHDEQLRLALERELVLRRQRDIEHQQQNHTPEAAPSLGPRFR